MIGVIPRLALISVLTILVMASAVGRVYAKHESRKLFTELQSMIAARDELEVEWGRLQIEQSMWSRHARVEQMARQEMHMRTPRPNEIQLMRP